MLGTIVNNKQLMKLNSQGIIRITPFDVNKIQTIHYPLNIKLIYPIDSDGELDRPNILKKNKPYKLAPNEYVVIEIDEHIELGNGVIGEFIPSSNLIEKGLSLICGKLDSGYGAKGEKIRFGLKNLLNQEVVIEYDLKIAYVRFFDLTALDNLPYELSPEEFKLWRVRANRAIDDGPIPEDE